MMQTWGGKKDNVCNKLFTFYFYTVVYWHECVAVWILLHLQIRLHLTVLKINRN